MSRRVSASAKKPYGVRRVCKVWEISASTFYAWLKRQQTNVIPLRRGPQGPLPDEDLVSAIKNIIKTSPFTAEGYRKIWAKLRFRGIRTSKSFLQKYIQKVE